MCVCVCVCVCKCRLKFPTVFLLYFGIGQMIFCECEAIVFPKVEHEIFANKLEDETFSDSLLYPCSNN